jgi:hypothetical protein
VFELVGFAFAMANGQRPSAIDIRSYPAAKKMLPFTAAFSSLIHQPLS